MNAWVSLVVEEEVVDQALVLAGSLRRARTCNRLVVILAPKISTYSRQRLSNGFDLVLQVGQDAGEAGEFSSVLMAAMSLLSFRKCVYLSPSMLVVRNCDSIFEDEDFVRRIKTVPQSLESFLFIPSIKLAEAVRGDLLEQQTLTKLNHVQIVEKLAAHFGQVSQLDIDQCNVEIFTGENGKPTIISEGKRGAITNFKGCHPAELWRNGVEPNVFEAQEAVVSFAWRILLEDVAGAELIRAPRGNGNNNEPVAIVGMSFRLPGGNTPDSFWNTLIEGKDAVRVAPPGRWAPKRVRSYWKDKTVQGGFISDPIDEFDAKFFGVSRKEAVLMDPQLRLLLEVSWEALEDAGIQPHTLYGSQAGIFTGSWTLNYRDLAMHTPDFDFFRSYMGNSIATGAARLSHFYGCTGPSIATESGCSASIVAVGLAVKSLRARECPLALACGVNLLIRPFNYKTMEGILSPDYRCKTFDASANGFVRAEGITTLVLKRLSDAFRDGDNIWGLVRGTGIAQEGVSKSLGTPTVHCESLAMKLALRDAGVKPQDVSYIEMHGTGTSVGDPMEVAAVAEAYRVDNRKEPIVIGSVKTNIGHTESVSGIAGIIKVLLSMKREKIPPHLHLQTLNPELDLERIPAVIPQQVMEWPRDPSRSRIAGVSSFGISGTDGHVILQEPPPTPSSSASFPRNYCHLERPLQLLKLSAKSAESLELMVDRYREVLEGCQSNNLDDFRDICYSANTSRSTFPHRAVLLARGAVEAAQLLRERSFKREEVQGATNSLCFLFTGQGSQYHGMASTLYATSPTFQLHFDEADSILQSRFRISIKDVMWGDSSSDAQLSKTLYSQTSIFVVEYCLLRLWESWGVKPDYVLGHSLGEFTAAVAAGALKFEEALLLVAERSRLIDSLPQGKMLVIKANQAEVDRTIVKYKSENTDFWTDTAALNSNNQTVLAGDSDQIQGFAKFCTQSGLKNIVLASTHAFHSRHMDPMLESYGKIIANTVQYDGRHRGKGNHPRYISGLEGRLIPTEGINASYWIRHTREKVSFLEATNVAAANGCNLFLEVGPSPILSALTATNLESPSSTPIRCLASLRKTTTNDWSVLLESLGQLYLSSWKGSIDWKGFDRDYYPRKRVPLPFYPFNRKSLWLDLRPEPGLLHPLVGRAVPNSTNHILYENELLLKSARFLQDHVIGNTIVFPGAGFLEMCLVAGYASVQRLKNELHMPRRSIRLSALTISTPLAIHESASTLLQTAVLLDEEHLEEGGYSVRVTRHNSEQSGEAEWVTHATAQFHPTVGSLPGVDIDKIDLESKTASSSWTPYSVSHFYNSLPQLGLRFGPSFQSLEDGWKGEEGMLLKAKLPANQPTTNSSYLIHPILADAMLQALMLWRSESEDESGGGRGARRKLQVPVFIRDFVWVQSSADNHDNRSRYLLCQTDRDGAASCSLVDGQGLLLATMSSVEFLETNVKLVEGMIAQQSVAMPKVWEEIYRSGPAPAGNRLEMKTINWEPSETFLNRKATCSVVSEAEGAYYTRLCNMARSFVLEALYSCGWAPRQGHHISVEQLLEQLNIADSHRKYINFFLRSMAGVGLLEWEESADTFRFHSRPPTLQELSEELRPFRSPEEVIRIESKVIFEVGKNLKGILRGEVSPLQILFPSDPSKPSAAQVYVQLMSSFAGAIQLANEQVLTPLLQQAAEHHHAQVGGGGGNQNGVVRILEVGAGTGSFSRIMLAFLASSSQPLPVEYYYTDVSPSFFPAAQAELAEKYESCSLVFKRLDMEEDPLEQGFSPGYFDLLLACEALHVATDVKAALKRLRPLLKPGGLVQIIETIFQDPRGTFVFGLLDSYWNFQDLDFRRDHIALSPAMWEEALLSADFERVELIPAYQGVNGVFLAFASKEERNTMTELGAPRHTWLLFDEGSSLSQRLAEKLSKLNRHVVRIPRRAPTGGEEYAEEELRELVTSLIPSTADNKLEGVLYLWGIAGDKAITITNQAQISLPLVTLCQILSGAELETTKVVVVTKGMRDVETSPMELPFPGSLIGLSRAIGVEHSSMNLKSMDLSPDESLASQLEDIFFNLWGDSRHSPEIAFREGLQLVPKLVACKLGSVASDYSRLPHGVKRFQLILPPSRQFSDLEFAFLEDYELEADQVELQVKAAALNFRDVFAVLKPTPEFEKINAVGVDVAGVVVRVGSGVEKFKVGDLAISFQSRVNLALPSHVRARETLVMPLPQRLTFAEGATIPTVFMTVHHCLGTVAEMKAGERVLVHTASGGVGLAAIQLAKLVGAEVIATAGSPRKRKFLRDLGLQHVFNSRTTHFGEKVLEATQGSGVDIVLNSLTGPGFKEESLRVLKQGGRFVEMSKLNVWSVEEVAVLRTDVAYSIEDIGSLDEETITDAKNVIQGYLQQGLIQPMPYERFDALNIRRALAHMQAAKQIGKIVCVMPELGLGVKNYFARTPLFNDNSTYLVTGGLGGIGLEVVKWILGSGGKHVVIASRSTPKPVAAAQIQFWNSVEGKHVVAVAVDVGNLVGCSQLLTDIAEDPTFPPLRGVMHAAGVLADATLQNQSWERFRLTFNAKVDGSWNLHELTKGLWLEHFVLFSSITATFGAPGQSNHCASNSFEDTLAHYRHSIGLPATSVNWANWGEVGVATDIDLPGVTPLSTAQGILALETLLRSPVKTNVAVANIDSFSALAKLYTYVRDFLDDRSLLGDSAETTIIINPNEFWNRLETAGDEEARLLLFRDLVMTTLKVVLRSAPEERIDENADFAFLGIDSLMMLEVKNGIQSILGARVALTLAHLQSSNTPALLAETLLSLLRNGGNVPQERPECWPTFDQLKLLVREDSQLPAHIQGDTTATLSTSQVGTVLLTGATGTLGPFLLQELLQRAHICAVYCLIRKTGKLSPAEKLSSALQKSGLSELVDLRKVIIVEGEISDPCFGLSQAEYDSLAAKVEAVVHSAVKVDYNATYWRSPESNKSTMRSTNVSGMLRVLEFCTSGRLKQLCHMSTILVYAKLGADGYLSEGWQDVDAFDNITINTGYPISKHVCEQLVRQAVERGVPVKTIRLPLVGGHSQTGRCEPNHFLLRLLTEMKLGCMPDAPFPLPCIPVDRSAELSLKIFFHEPSEWGVYNLTQKLPELEQELVFLAKREFGIDITLVSYEEFIDKVLAEDEASPLAPFKTLYTQDFATNPDSPYVKIMRSFTVKRDYFFPNGKTMEILPDLERVLGPSSACFRRDLWYLKEAGYFDKFGIVCK